MPEVVMKMSRILLRDLYSFIVGLPISKGIIHKLKVRKRSSLGINRESLNRSIKKEIVSKSTPTPLQG
jgi:hypothetical protein